MKVKSKSEVAQLCPTLSDPIDGSLPGSSVHGIFQARVLEWGAIAFSIVKPKSEQITSLPKSFQPLIITCRIKPKLLTMALVAQVVAVLATFADFIASRRHLVESPEATHIAFFLFHKLSSLILSSELLPFRLHLMQLFCPQRPEFSLPQTLAHTVHLQWLWPSAIYIASSFQSRFNISFSHCLSLISQS